MSAARLQAVLDTRARQALVLDGYAESAVLLPLLVEPGATSLDDARLIFTVRRDDLRTHAGQISFPGGRRDPEDADLVATALREAHEEIGVPPGRVQVVGLLDDVPTPSSYVITPVVGVIEGAITLAPQAAEVAATFECSLRELAALYTVEGERTWQGFHYVMHTYHVGEHRIWGATARMVHQLLELRAQS